MAIKNMLSFQVQSTLDPTTLLYGVPTASNVDTALPVSVLFTSTAFTGSPTVGGLPIATTTGVQTLTNKTLTFPVISTISNTGTITIPTGTDTLVGRATTDTLTNKTLTAPIIATISNTGTLTLPTTTDTLVGRATTDTLINKTLTSPTINGGALSGTFSGNITFSGTITPSAGIVGTNTNNNATAGNVGEFISNSAGGVVLTAATAANVTSISLTAGDWEVYGNVAFSPAGSTVVNACALWISTTSATVPAVPNYNQVNAQGTGNFTALNAPTIRLSLASTTTVYISCLAQFTTSSMNAAGNIGARRMR